jgi:cyclase
MKKKRLIPVLLLKNGFLVQSKLFSRYQNLGNPIISVRRLSNWAADELLYLDISSEKSYDMRRDDLRHPNRDNIVDIIRDVSEECNMPITVGGRIRSLKDIQKRLEAGADKVSINTMAVDNSDFVSEASKEFGSQCIVVSIDAKLVGGSYSVMTEGGRREANYDPVEWAKINEDRGAGEILINSIDRDGTRKGYDLRLVGSVAETVRIPVIACGGVGEWLDLAEALQKTTVDAVAAANIFHYYDQSVYLAKKYLYDRGYNVRPSQLII